MELLLVRHAKSAHDYSRWKTDDIRPLADKGRKRQHAATEGMIKVGLEYSTTWVSPFKRAQQTLEIIQEHYGTSITPRVVDELRVWGDSHEVKELIEDHYQSNPHDKLLLVGHNPNMSTLVGILTDKSIGMRTSDLVHILRTDEGYTLKKYYPRKVLMNA